LSHAAPGHQPAGCSSARCSGFLGYSLHSEYPLENEFEVRGTALELEPKTLRLKAPQAMHQPVVLLDQNRVDASLGSDQTDQLP
jgi:hypothetical protein